MIRLVLFVVLRCFVISVGGLVFVVYWFWFVAIRCCGLCRLTCLRLITGGSVCLFICVAWLVVAG